MGQDNKGKVMEVFYEFPEKVFTVREIVKVSGVARATAHKILVELKKDGMVEKDGRASWNRLFLTRKVNYHVEKIVASGLIDFLVERFNPSAIVLFGSVSRGDSVKESDVDIFIEAAVDNSDEVLMKLDLKKFEKKIGHSVELFLENRVIDLKKKNPHLFNNVVNGVKLYGVFDLK
jgi:predicted nucleotidyltransferase